MDFIFDPGLVLYLPLSERDGASFMSQDAYGRQCTVIGALWTPQGRDFDGVDDKLTFPALMPAAGTLETWILWKRLASTVADNQMLYYNLILQDPGNNYLYIRPGVTRYFPYIPPLNQWLHLVFTWTDSSDVTTLKLYADLVEKAMAGSGAYGLGNINTLCAHVSDLWFLKAQVGEVRLYSRALTFLELQRNYLAIKGRFV